MAASSRILRHWDQRPRWSSALPMRLAPSAPVLMWSFRTALPMRSDRERRYPVSTTSGPSFMETGLTVGGRPPSSEPWPIPSRSTCRSTTRSFLVSQSTKTGSCSWFTGGRRLESAATRRQASAKYRSTPTTAPPIGEATTSICAVTSCRTPPQAVATLATATRIVSITFSRWHRSMR